MWEEEEPGKLPEKEEPRSRGEQGPRNGQAIPSGSEESPLPLVGLPPTHVPGREAQAPEPVAHCHHACSASAVGPSQEQITCPRLGQESHLESMP